MKNGEGSLIFNSTQHRCAHKFVYFIDFHLRSKTEKVDEFGQCQLTVVEKHKNCSQILFHRDYWMAEEEVDGLCGASLDDVTSIFGISAASSPLPIEQLLQRCHLGVPLRSELLRLLPIQTKTIV